jgi:integral membrane protein
LASANKHDCLPLQKFLIMLKLFKLIALIEGISAIALFFIVMPLKYIWHNEEFMRPIGMAHGVLFCIYIAFAVICKVQYKWDWKKFIIICLASIPPLGTFYIERKYLNTATV